MYLRSWRDFRGSGRKWLQVIGIGGFQQRNYGFQPFVLVLRLTKVTARWCLIAIAPTMCIIPSVCVIPVNVLGPEGDK